MLLNKPMQGIQCGSWSIVVACRWGSRVARIAPVQKDTFTVPDVLNCSGAFLRVMLPCSLCHRTNIRWTSHGLGTFLCTSCYLHGIFVAHGYIPGELRPACEWCTILNDKGLTSNGIVVVWYNPEIAIVEKQSRVNSIFDKWMRKKSLQENLIRMPSPLLFV